MFQPASNSNRSSVPLSVNVDDKHIFPPYPSPPNYVCPQHPTHSPSSHSILPSFLKILISAEADQTLCHLVMIATQTAAPYTTASSLLMDLLSAVPLKKSLGSFWILVEPPTKTVSLIEFLSILPFLIAFSTSSNVPLNKSDQSSPNPAVVVEV